MLDSSAGAGGGVRRGETAEGPVLMHRAFGPHGGTGDDASWNWFHLDRSHRGAAEWLRARGLPEQAVEALLDRDVRARLTRAPGGAVLIARMARDPASPAATDASTNRPAAEKRDGDLVSLRLWLGGRTILSLSRGLPAALAALRKRGNAHDGGASFEAPGTVLADLIETVVDSVTPHVAALSAEVDELEDRVIGPPAEVDAGLAERLVALRRTVVRLHRHLGPQHDALAALLRLEARGDAPVAFDEGARLDLAESVEQCRQDADEVEQTHERALILRDELARRADERTARHGFALSVAAAVFLPATFLTGLLGINVGGIPGADAPHAFWWVAGLCAGVAGASAAFVLWRRWL